MRKATQKKKEIQIFYIDRENVAHVTIGFRVAKLGRGYFSANLMFFTNSVSLTKSSNFAKPLFIHHKNEDSTSHHIAVRSRKRPCTWCFVNSKAMCVFIIILNCRGQNNNHNPYLKFTKIDSQDSPFRLKIKSQLPYLDTECVPCYGLLLPVQNHLFSSPYYHQT